jgi:DNA-binding response OmpR family regulator
MAAKRILLVEDEAAIRELLTYAVDAEGYVVDAAASVAEAWALLDANSYALAIVDWQLPDGDGTIIADGAAELGAKSFLMSGYLVRMPGGRADAHLTLMKPIRPSELIAAVREAIGGPGAPTTG